MDNTLKEQLLQSVFRFRKVGTTFPPQINSRMNELDINIAELVLMKEVEDNISDSDANVSISDIQEFLFISKAAVSQMLSSLEKKGYLNREIDKKNRRKLIVTLTPKGQEVVRQMEEQADRMLTVIISRLGEEDTKQLIEIFGRFADIVEELKDEDLQTDNTN